MLRIVLDTNIFISALLQPQGPPAEVFVLALAGEDVRLGVSADIYAEYEEVIRRPRFRRSEREITNALRAVREQSFWVKPSQKVHACSDPDDDVFLECAQPAQAHFVVTGNRKHFPSSWAETRIATAREFLDTLAEVQQQKNPRKIKAEVCRVILPACPS
jgi:uncharacterized protein